MAKVPFTLKYPQIWQIGLKVSGVSTNQNGEKILRIGESLLIKKNETNIEVEILPIIEKMLKDFEPKNLAVLKTILDLTNDKATIIRNSKAIDSLAIDLFISEGVKVIDHQTDKQTILCRCQYLQVAE